MELNISELDNINTHIDNFDYNGYHQENYWEKQQIHETKPKKNKVSFDDILSNMNLVVNNQGVLQMMIPSQNNNNNNILPNQNHEYNPNQFYTSQQTNHNYYQRPPQQNAQQPIKKNNEPLDPNVKHSYIFNKYFKEYNDSYVENPSPRIPKTMEEYKQMLLDDKIKAIQHKKLLEQIKPKKMMFTSNPGMSLNPTNINASKNNLRMMNFR
jgi:hypothetical protein